MLADITYIAFFVLLAEYVLSNLYNFGRANWLDVQKIRQNKLVKVSKAKLRSRPTLDIFVCSYNDARAVSRTLDSIFSQDYKNFRVIIIDNKSSQRSLRSIREQIASYPKKAVKLIAKTKFSKRSLAVNQNVIKHAKADWLLVLDAGYSLEKQTLSNANRQFLSNGKLSAVVPNIQILHNDTLKGLLQQTQEQLKLASKKASRLKSANLIQNSAVFYKWHEFKKPTAGPGSGKIIFDETIIVSSLPLSYKKWLAQKLVASGKFRTIISALQAFAVVYMLFVAIKYDAAIYIFLVYAAFVLVVGLNLITDNSSKIFTKFKSAIMFIPLFSLYILDNLIAIIALPFYSLKKH